MFAANYPQKPFPDAAISRLYLLVTLIAGVFLKLLWEEKQKNGACVRGAQVFGVLQSEPDRHVNIPCHMHSAADADQRPT